MAQLIGNGCIPGMIGVGDHFSAYVREGAEHSVQYWGLAQMTTAVLTAARAYM